jgi:acyl-coenzyme A synthetase/AMP-(fatty) acid ligase
VVQRRPDAFEVALVTVPGCDQERIRRRVTDNFREQFGRTTETAISFVDDLPRTAHGKVRPVLSLVGRSPTEAARQLRV